MGQRRWYNISVERAELTYWSLKLDRSSVLALYCRADKRSRLLTCDHFVSTIKVVLGIVIDVVELYFVHIGQAPKYLSDCVSTVSAASGRYRLRSTGSAAYILRRTRTKFCEHGFFYSSPAAWNTLPPDLYDITDTSTFWKRLKNVLFDRAYNWLLLALLDKSYSGTLQISCWLIDWLIDCISSDSGHTEVFLIVSLPVVLYR